MCYLRADYQMVIYIEPCGSNPTGFSAKITNNNRGKMLICTFALVSNFKTLIAPRLSDYSSTLPENRIAMHPPAERDAAKMLVYDNANRIIHSQFKKLGSFLPENTLLVLNDTRVVHARLLFQRATGAAVEIFCLNPLLPYTEMNMAMQVTGSTTWECLAGNQKRWKIGETLTLPINHLGELHAKLKEKKRREVIVEFSWEPTNMRWAEVLEKAGKMPLPPYIHRDAEIIDEEDYQTVFAKQDGAVAAPTAGLHFTENLLEGLKNKGIQIAHVTLHVGAGTFQPVAHENVLEHPMHREQVIYEKPLIEKIASGKYSTVAGGTTSLRALESLYWFGNELETHPECKVFFVEKLQPYTGTSHVSLQQSMANILEWMAKKGLETLHGETEIFIFPGYDFKVCKGLITNFHQPQSTLLMLVSAFIGNTWKELYEIALDNDYRFLSYGDGMLLMG
jgi:S-adenosylmethionine:tRNA ribosyltransferase-isomerase